MSSLTNSERYIIEELFNMETGYVLDFNNQTFARFINRAVNIDIYGGSGYEGNCSKANKLRQIWDDEPDSLVGILIEELLAYYEGWQSRKDEELTDSPEEDIAELHIIIQRLKDNDAPVDLPDKPEEDFQTLKEDIKQSLAKNKPELVLDRLHTFALKLLRQTCIDNGINIKNEKGINLPLQSLAGMLRKKYEEYEIFEVTFTLLALQNSISLFDSYNTIRNDKSFAHPNEILQKLEADFAVKIMANVITFIDSVESLRQSIESEEIKIGNAITQFDLPF